MQTKLILLLLTLGSPLFSQRIFITGEKHRADFDVIFTRNKWRADLCIQWVSYPHHAGRSRTRHGCDNWFPVQNLWEADLVIRVVNSKHPYRKTLYVYREIDRGYSPPTRDRTEPDDYPYRREYDDDYYSGEYYPNHSPRVRIHIEPSLFFRFH